jgi:hypothetical protein
MPDSTIFALGGVGGDAQPDSHLERSLSSFSAGNTWSALRGDASTSGDSEDNSSGTENTGVHNLEDTGRGTTNTRQIDRSFFAFDLSGESSTVASADLKIVTDNLGDTDTNSSTVYVVAATDLSSNTGDYGNVFSSGTTLGTLFGSTTISTTQQYHTWTLNSDAISRINTLIGSGGIFTIGLMGYYDYNNSAPGSNELKIQVLYANQIGTSSDPKLELTFSAAAGFGHKTIGVASANIGKIKGVATANVGKVIGVD